MLEGFILGYEGLIHHIAELIVCTLELVGMLIIVVGSVKALATIGVSLKSKRHSNIVIGLGRSLSLALEFKMGAEIVNTVIIRDLRELAILGIVILIRALLAVLIHWEMKMEKESEKQE
jgi:uncharacterized membrane protein